MAAPIYATSSDYADWVNSPDVAVSERLFRQASRIIDEALFGAVYDTDTTGAPTDTTVIEALRDATCAQVEWMDARGDTDGIGDTQEADSASIGSVSYSGIRSSTPISRTTSGAELAPTAKRELAAAGLRMVVFVRG